MTCGGYYVYPISQGSLNLCLLSLSLFKIRESVEITIDKSVTRYHTVNIFVVIDDRFMQDYLDKNRLIDFEPASC